MFNDEVYENEFGKCAYLAGAIDVITGDLSVAFYNAGVQYEALAADVFCIQADAEVDINQLVCERLEKHVREEFCDSRTDKRLEDAKQLRVETIACAKSMKDAIIDLYRVSQWDIDMSKLEAATESYCADVKYYLGEPIEVFTVTDETIRNAEILGYIYLHALFDIVFVRFKQHVVMFLRGSVE